MPNPVSFMIKIAAKQPPKTRILTAEQAKDPIWIKNAQQMNMYLSEPVSEKIVRQGDNSYEYIVYSNKAVAERWVVGKVVLFHENYFAPDSAGARDVNDGQTPRPAIADFPEFAWAQGSTPLSQESRDGKNCNFYERKSPTGDEKLWIDRQTKLPVAREDGKAVYSYAFDDKAEKLPAIPDAYREVYQTAIRGIEARAKNAQNTAKPESSPQSPSST